MDCYCAACAPPSCCPLIELLAPEGQADSPILHLTLLGDDVELLIVTYVLCNNQQPLLQLHTCLVMYLVILVMDQEYPVCIE